MQCWRTGLGAAITRLVLAKKLAAITTKVHCRDEEYLARPLYKSVGVLMKVLCDEFKQEDARTLVDWWNPQTLEKESTRALWNRLFDMLQFGGTVRFDVVSSAASFFSDRCFLTEKSLARDEWDALYDALKEEKN